MWVSLGVEVGMRMGWVGVKVEGSVGMGVRECECGYG